MDERQQAYHALDSLLAAARDLANAQAWYDQALARMQGILHEAFPLKGKD